MEIPQHILKRLKQNERIAEKFNEIEVSILAILNFQDFLEKLLSEISTQFSIPYTWISIIQDSPIADQLYAVKNSRLLTQSTAFVERNDFLSITRNSLVPILANQDLHRFDSLRPQVPAWRMGSLSIAPITLDGEVVGSINQADPNPNRFEPGIDTSLLERLAVKVSLCLSNVNAHERLRFMAFHDPLTGLLNRGVMKRILEREFLRARRYNHSLSLIFLDLDDFKGINDSFGHDVGDHALCHVANILTGLKRDSDVVARFAGDEFVVILPSTSPPQAEAYINRVKHRLSTEPLSAVDGSIFVQLSHGVSCLDDPGILSAKDLLKSADRLLYRAKEKKQAS